MFTSFSKPINRHCASIVILCVIIRTATKLRDLSYSCANYCAKVFQAFSLPIVIAASPEFQCQTAVGHQTQSQTTKSAKVLVVVVISLVAHFSLSPQNGSQQVLRSNAAAATTETATEKRDRQTTSTDVTVFHSVTSEKSSKKYLSSAATAPPQSVAEQSFLWPSGKSICRVCLPTAAAAAAEAGAAKN